MVVGKVEALLFDTIKDDFNQKQRDISEMEGKLSYLLTVDSILVGLLTTIMGLSYFGIEIEAIILLATRFIARNPIDFDVDRNLSGLP
jgi:hypothetical protein